MTHAAVLGLGGTIDYEIDWDPATVQSLAARLGIVDLSPRPPAQIDSERELLLSILCHLREGTGGEYFVGSSDVIDRFAEHFDYRVTLGGTAVRAALAMHMFQIPSTVHMVSTNETVRRLLPSTVDCLCSADHDSTDPHLIVQYPAGTRIRVGSHGIVAPSANRLIYPSDRPNRDMVLSDDLPAALRTARVFLVSGLNSIQEPEVLDARLAQLTSDMRELPGDAVVVYEDATFHVPAFSRHVRDVVAARANIYSLNEDELNAYTGRTVDLRDADDVRSAVLGLHAEVSVPALVLHTRHFALAHGPDAHRLRAILESGIAVSAARYAHGDRAQRSDIDRYLNNPARDPAGRSVVTDVESSGGSQFCGVPALDLRDISSPTTVGLGDTFTGGMIAALLPGPTGTGPLDR